MLAQPSVWLSGGATKSEWLTNGDGTVFLVLHLVKLVLHPWVLWLYFLNGVYFSILTSIPVLCHSPYTSVVSALLWNQFLFVFTNWSMSHNDFLRSFWTCLKLTSFFYLICLYIVISWYRFVLLNSNKLQIHSLISNKRHFIKVSEYLIVADLIAHVTASNHTNWLACGPLSRS